LAPPITTASGQCLRLLRALFFIAVDLLSQLVSNFNDSNISAEIYYLKTYKTHHKIIYEILIKYYTDLIIKVANIALAELTSGSAYTLCCIPAHASIMMLHY